MLNNGPRLTQEVLNNSPKWTDNCAITVPIDQKVLNHGVGKPEMLNNGPRLTKKCSTTGGGGVNAPKKLIGF